MVDDYYLHHKATPETDDILPQLADERFEDMLVLRGTEVQEPMAVDSLRAVMGPTLPDTREGVAQGPCARDELQRIYKL